MRRPTAGLRLALLGVLCVGCVAATVGSVIRARASAAPPVLQAGADSTPSTVEAGQDAFAEWRQHPMLVFSSTAPDASYGKVAVVPLDDPDGPRYVTSLECTRVYFSAGQGICLDGHQGGLMPTYSVDLFDDQFQIRPSFHGTRLAGPPSRTRISPDGHYAATTAFASGDGYSAPSFSTRTNLMDVTTGAILSDLEQFTVYRDGEQFSSPDFNFWGVTFSHDSGTFYATLGTSGTTYLIQGDVATREASTLLEGVECPSLSPDGTRIAFKQRTGGSGLSTTWRLAILDLASMQWSPLTAETRSVDDQVEWLDNDHVLYGLPDTPGGVSVTSIWEMDVDGGGPPKVYVPRAWSPAVVR